MALEEDFLDNICHSNTGCWLWTGGVMKSGKGECKLCRRIRDSKRKYGYDKSALLIESMKSMY